MEKTTVVLIPGDGIGPEVTQATRDCIDALGTDIEWRVAQAGEPALKTDGDLLPQKTLDLIKKHKIALKGPITTPIGTGFRSINVALRQELDLYACVRPTWHIEGIKGSRPGLNLVIVRENSEDLYAGVEFEETNPETIELIKYINNISKKKVRVGSAISIKPFSPFGCERVARYGFELAKREGRKKVTCVHKANIMKYTDGMFLRTFQQVAKDYPEIESGDVIVDNLCMQLVMRPEQFEVLVLPNLYGDIVSDLCAGLAGGLGIACGANIGKDTAVFEPVHGSAPKYAGMNKANPTATILSANMMLKHMGKLKESKILEDSLVSVIREGKDVTYDLKVDRNDPTAVGTHEFAQAIVKKISASK
jgi:isocitrate dehydrogenase (NAD+)